MLSTSGRSFTPTSLRTPSIPNRGPTSSSASVSGTSRSTSLACTDVETSLPIAVASSIGIDGPMFTRRQRDLHEVPAGLLRLRAEVDRRRLQHLDHPAQVPVAHLGRHPGHLDPRADRLPDRVARRLGQDVRLRGHLDVVRRQQVVLAADGLAEAEHVGGGHKRSLRRAADLGRPASIARRGDSFRPRAGRCHGRRATSRRRGLPSRYGDPSAAPYCSTSANPAATTSRVTSAEV